MLKCCKCEEIKSFDQFPIRLDRKRGYSSYCQLCEALRHKEWLEKNPDKKQHERKLVKQWVNANPGKKNALTANRTKALLQRMPKWLNEIQLKEIEQFYIDSAYLTNYTKVNFEVDHIVPLQGKNVSGLHVPWNLQLLTESENRKKHNSYKG